MIVSPVNSTPRSLMSVRRAMHLSGINIVYGVESYNNVRPAYQVQIFASAEPNYHDEIPAQVPGNSVPYFLARPKNHLLWTGIHSLGTLYI